MKEIEINESIVYAFIFFSAMIFLILLGLKLEGGSLNWYWVFSSIFIVLSCFFYACTAYIMKGLKS